MVEVGHPGGTFTAISNTNSVSYTPVAADATKFLKAAVTYTDGFGSPVGGDYSRCWLLRR